MSKRVFVSYSHKDEQLKEDFFEHLAPLKRNGQIDVWHDRDINAGNDWKEKIDENLENADIIILLISSSFLASDYCYSIEMKRAIERKQDGKAEIILVILRPCHWQILEFSRYQGLPKDGVPIINWDNPDEGWLDVVNGISTTIEDMSLVPVESKPILINADIKLSNIAMNWLDDTEVVLTHRKVSRIKLSDVFVLPDIELQPDKKQDTVDIKSSKLIVNKPKKYLIYGEEQQGKTTLLKYAYKEFSIKENIPIYLNAEDIKTKELDTLLKSAIDEQYVNLDYEEIDDNKVVLLIDNIDSIGIRDRFRDKLLEDANSRFKYIIQTCESSYSFILSESTLFDNYDVVKLLGLGHLKREEMSLNWISLGQVETISEEKLYSECQEVKAKLNTIIKKNIVPPKPLYVLMLLQFFEANLNLDLEMTSYGHCYQQLIYQSLEKAKIKNENFDAYLNILTELSWVMYKSNGHLNKNAMEKFFKEYKEEYILNLSIEDVLKVLLEVSILLETETGYLFKYPYIYYFFVGKKIAESYSTSEDVRLSVKELLKTLHREDSANILIFISHHTKDRWILDEINTVLSSLFKGQRVATLEKDQIAFMKGFVEKIPDLVIEQREIQKERDDYNKRLDDLERKANNEDDIESLEILADINQTFKGMEVAGQLIRNRHSSLKKRELFDLAEKGAQSGLRFLEYFFEISEVAKTEVIKLIGDLLSDNPELTDDEVEENAKQAYLKLSYGVINGVLRKIGTSIGSKEALQIYKQLDETHETSAFVLIRQAIELHYNKGINTEEIEKAAKFLNDNRVCLQILKEMVIQHVYMFPLQFKEKQKIAHILGLPIKNQQLMERKQRARLEKVKR
ncbi:TIR domain-containing protein [Kangiella sp. TOML190]|uniref:TIR domain-containing protein n=1 Tax=Kangiella sp. TOML190 TaxID=2931351 RepID=UPI002040925C|nr:TIR domain-containing protein [Kangiella sp. TOML190]